MRVEDRLDKVTVKRLRQLSGSKIKNKKDRNIKQKHQEDFSDRDIEDLMGINMPTYKRCRGALRQR